MKLYSRNNVWFPFTTQRKLKGRNNSCCDYLYDTLLRGHNKHSQTSIDIPGVENVSDHGTIGPRKFF